MENSAPRAKGHVRKLVFLYETYLPIAIYYDVEITYNYFFAPNLILGIKLRLTGRWVYTDKNMKIGLMA